MSQLHNYFFDMNDNLLSATNYYVKLIPWHMYIPFLFHLKLKECIIIKFDYVLFYSINYVGVYGKRGVPLASFLIL